MQDFDLDDGDEEKQENKCIKVWRKYLIDPSNMKLRRFHIVACISLYIDFFVSSAIMGNYRF